MQWSLTSRTGALKKAENIELLRRKETIAQETISQWLGLARVKRERSTRKRKSDTVTVKGKASEQSNDLGFSLKYYGDSLQQVLWKRKEWLLKTPAAPCCVFCFRTTGNPCPLPSPYLEALPQSTNGVFGVFNLFCDEWIPSLIFWEENFPTMKPLTGSNSVLKCWRTPFHWSHCDLWGKQVPALLVPLWPWEGHFSGKWSPRSFPVLKLYVTTGNARRVSFHFIKEMQHRADIEISNKSFASILPGTPKSQTS